MNPAFVGIIVRHVLTGVGSVLIAKGYTDTAALESIIGGATALLGLALSYFNKKRNDIL